jgi:hypothetical protein
MRIAAIGDLHCTVDSRREIGRILEGVDRAADILLLAGDIANVGLIEEIMPLLEETRNIRIPIVAVLGNHDHENDQAELLINAMTKAGICVLDNTTCVVDGIGFIGTKGFCGGFGERRIQSFGERAIKAFVQASVDEAIQLERSLQELKTPRRVALLHYSPVKGTLEGESPEIYPFLGSSLLGDALDRHGVEIVFHGHAHHGSPSGYTEGGIPVHNVSRFVRSRDGQRRYHLFEI